MTQKQKIIGASMLVVGMLFLSGCGQKETSQKQNQTGMVSNQEQQNGAKNQNQTEKQSTMSASLKELMSLGKDLKCQWEITDQTDGNLGKGVVYLSGGKFRQEMTIESAGEDLAGEKFFSVSDGEWIYSWNSKENKGMKAKISEMEKLTNQNQNQNQNQMGQPEQQLNLEEKFQYHCEDWKADESLFVPDKKVDFMDMGEMVQQAQQLQNNLQQGSNGLQNMCNMCQQLPQEARAECLKSCGQ